MRRNPGVRPREGAREGALIAAPDGPAFPGGLVYLAGLLLKTRGAMAGRLQADTLHGAGRFRALRWRIGERAGADSPRLTGDFVFAGQCELPSIRV